MARLSEKIAYGFGDMASSMFWKIFSYYLPIFYSDVFGLKPAHAATLLLVTKCYDAISDPVMGLIADRTHSRWGKYRPWLLWMALPFALVGIASFYVPNVGYEAKHLYAYLMYLLMMTAYTAVNVPYGAMLGVVSADSGEKSVFSSYRMFFAYVGSFLAMGIFWLFEKKVIGTEGPSGRIIRGVGDAAPLQWTATIALVAVLCAILFLLCFALTREHVTESGEKRTASVAEDIKALLRNSPWWLLLGAGIGQLLFSSLRGGAAAYYFANILGESPVVTCSVFLLVGEVAQMAGVTLAVPLSGRLGKRSTFLFSLLGIALLSCGIYFLPDTVAGMWLLVVLQVLICIGIGVGSPLIWSMFADVADASELEHGSGSTGLIFSSSSMAQKAGGALGGFLLLMILAHAGYDKDMAVQGEGTLRAIKALMSFIPAIGAALGAVCLCFYPYTTERMKGIQEALKKQREEI